MYDQENASRLYYSLRIRRQRLERRINLLILRDGLGDGHLTRSAINSRLRSRLHSRYRMFN